MLVKKSAALFFFLFYSALAIQAQSVVNVGSESTLDVATWNIEWFGSASNGPSNDNLQISNAEAIIQGSGIDLWGVQEIADGDDFEDMITALGNDYAGVLATNSVEQKIGFVYDTNVIQVRQVRHVLEDFSHAFASRPPLQLEANVVLPDTTVIVTFIVLHMKAFSDPESYERRVDASTRLKNHIDFTMLENEHVIVLGDFNDELERSTSGGRTSPYNNFVTDTDNYAFLTLPIEQSGGGSFCSNTSCTSTGSMLDHVLISDELFGDYVSNSAGFIPNLPDDIPVFGSSTSDHLPVIAQFDFTQPDFTSSEDEAVINPFQISHPYPNPFTKSTRFEVQLNAPEYLHIRVFNLLGQEVAVLSDKVVQSGKHEFRWQPSQHPAGMYMVRIQTETQVQSFPIVLRP